MGLKDTVFEILSVLSARLSGEKSGRNAVLIGTVAGERIVQPQRTLVFVRHFYVDQASGTAVQVIPSIVELLGLKNELDLKNYEMGIFIRMVSSDMSADDNLAIQLYASGAIQLMTLQNVGYTTNEAGINGIKFHLDADHNAVRVDSTDWSAAETHSYIVSTEFYRLTDGIGQFSL